MSEVKHQPATPLPWRVMRNVRDVNREHALVGSDTEAVACINVLQGERAWHRAERNVQFIAHATENYQFLVRVLKSELAEHERLKQEHGRLDWRGYHAERAGGIRALLNSIGEL